MTHINTKLIATLFAAYALGLGIQHSYLAYAVEYSFRHYRVLGEGRVRVEDAQGHFTGVDNEGVFIRNLNDVTYEFIGDGVIITMPADAPYRLVIQQEDDLSIQVIGADWGSGEHEQLYTPQAKAVFADVPATEGGIAVIEAAGAPLEQLMVAVDLDGDGEFEITRTPDAVLTDPVEVQDTTPPTTTIIADGPQDESGAYTGSVLITVTAEDEGSGVLRSYYSLDGGETWQEYVEPVEIQPGQATSIHAYSVDRAGNEDLPPKVKTFTFGGLPNGSLQPLTTPERNASEISAWIYWMYWTTIAVLATAGIILARRNESDRNIHPRDDKSGNTRTSDILNDRWAKQPKDNPNNMS